MSIVEYARSARDLAKNPLGIIALFITLIYGIAGLALSHDGLSSDQRTPLVWFLVLFPFAELGVFAWLVSRHHTKLYGPGDFKDERLFFVNMAASTREARVEREAQEITAATESKTLGPAGATSAPDGFRARILEAEELAFRKLESEFGLPVHRHFAVSVGRRTLYTDGFLGSPGGPNALIEIKYVPSPAISLLPLRLYLAEVRSLSSEPASRPFDIILAFVTDFPGELLDTFQKRVLDYLSTEPDDRVIHLRFFPYEPAPATRSR
jgi:hypothetical protein